MLTIMRCRLMSDIFSAFVYAKNSFLAYHIPLFFLRADETGWHSRSKAMQAEATPTNRWSKLLQPTPVRYGIAVVSPLVALGISLLFRGGLDPAPAW